MICAVEVQEEEENFHSSYCDNAYTFERTPGMVFTWEDNGYEYPDCAAVKEFCAWVPFALPADFH